MFSCISSHPILVGTYHEAEVTKKPPVNVFLTQSSHMYVVASSHLPAVDVIVLHRYSGDRKLSSPVDLILMEKGDRFESIASHLSTFYGISDSAEVCHYFSLA